MSNALWSRRRTASEHVSPTTLVKISRRSPPSPSVTPRPANTATGALANLLSLGRRRKTTADSGGELAAVDSSTTGLLSGSGAAGEAVRAGTTVGGAVSFCLIGFVLVVAADGAGVVGREEEASEGALPAADFFVAVVATGALVEPDPDLCWRAGVTVAVDDAVVITVHSS